MFHTHGKPYQRSESLTAVEELGLTKPYCLADGHAYQDLDVIQNGIIEKLPALWVDAQTLSHDSVEREFVHAFYKLAGQTSQTETNLFRLCTSASQSIDMVAAWLHRRAFTVGLVEPTFDNLAQIVRRWDVPTVPLDENSLYCDEGIYSLDTSAFEAIFLVCPNNPTGRCPSLTFFKNLIEWAEENKKVLIFDFCFRFFLPSMGDVFQLLRDSGVTFLAIEDTGKTWPSLDMKVSILTYSCDIAKQIEDLYSEILLCISPFTVSVMTEFVAATGRVGLSEGLWSQLQKNRHRLRSALGNEVLEIDSASLSNALPVEWVKIKRDEFNDLMVVRLLAGRGVACLPGRYFFWNDNQRGRDHVRFSLLKPAAVIDGACQILRDAFRSDLGAFAYKE